MNIDFIDKTITKIFNYKIILIIGAGVIALLTMNTVNLAAIDPLIVFLTLAIGIVTFVLLLEINVVQPPIAYLILQLMFVWIFLDSSILSNIGASFKPYAFVFGLSAITAVIYIFRNFEYLWSNFPVFRLLFLFFIFNILYLLFYHSDFKLSAVRAGYPVNFASDFSDLSAKYIIFLNSLSAFTAITISLMVFHNTNTMKIFENRLIYIIKYFSFVTLTYFLIVLTCFQFNTGVPGPGSFLPFFFYLFTSFKFFLAGLKDNLVPSFVNTVLNILVPVSFIMVLLTVNKTGSIAFLFSAICFFLINKDEINKIVFSKKAIELRNNRNFKILVCLILTLLLIYSIGAGFIDTIYNKFNIISQGLNTRGTLEIRMTNWHYFIADWFDNLNIIKTIFGFGLGASRELIFFISAMQSGNQLVQTTHNHYMDLFYDYGLVAFLYFGALISILISNIINITNRQTNSNVRIFSSASLAILVFFFIYNLMDGVRVSNGIIFFCLLGFLESVKYAYSNVSGYEAGEISSVE